MESEKNIIDQFLSFSEVWSNKLINQTKIDY